MVRPDRDTYFMGFARTAALRGSCARRRVGAVVVAARRVVATGHNGAPPGVPECCHVADDDSPCLLAEHAEWNAIVHGKSLGADLHDSTAYCTDGACLRCATLMLQVGVKRFVFERSFRDPAGVERLAAEIDVVQWSPPPGWADAWTAVEKAITS